MITQNQLKIWVKFHMNTDRTRSDTLTHTHTHTHTHIHTLTHTPTHKHTPTHSHTHTPHTHTLSQTHIYIYNWSSRCGKSSNSTNSKCPSTQLGCRRTKRPHISAIIKLSKQYIITYRTLPFTETFGSHIYCTAAFHSCCWSQFLQPSYKISIYLSIRLSSICLSVYHPSVCLSVCLSIYLSIYLSMFYSNLRLPQFSHHSCRFTASSETKFLCHITLSISASQFTSGRIRRRLPRGDHAHLH